MAEDGCRLCPRQCGVRRDLGGIGYCGVDDRLRVGRAALHMWEEPCISGGPDEWDLTGDADDADAPRMSVRAPGSGAVFFSGCPLRCVYCQNSDLAAARCGREITEERLGDIFLELQEKGAANINLVTPTHYTPQIIKALDRVRHRLHIPVVHNTGGYERVETLRMLDGYIDIYLTDFKYMDSALAERYSKAPDYPRVAQAALSEMVRQTGAPVFSRGGGQELMRKGVIVRHLMLPGQLIDAKKIVRHVYETYGNQVYLSLMNQYTPMPQVRGIPELDRRVKRKSYERLVDFAIGLGVENAYIQRGGTSKESFIPDFSGEGV